MIHCTAALLLLAAAAEGANYAGAFLEPGMGVRGPGMGNAHVALSADATATYWNPAGLVLLRGMDGARLPIPCAHGEGRAEFRHAADQDKLAAAGQICMRFVDNHGSPAETYPHNPNGSPGGITGLTTADGRVTIMMPHPERVFRNVQLSWRPPEWTDASSPWLRLFQNACEFARSS